MMELHLHDLPDLALERVVDFLDYGARRNIRQVSSTLKNFADEIGLAIKIDSRESVSTELLKTVVSTEVRIIHLDSFDLEPDDIRKWKAVIVSTPVKFTFLNDRIFRNCPNLRILIINEAALTGEELTSQSESDQCIKSLSELHIILNKKEFEKSLSKLYVQTEINDLSANFSEARVDNGISNIESTQGDDEISDNEKFWDCHEEVQAESDACDDDADADNKNDSGEADLEAEADDDDAYLDPVYIQLDSESDDENIQIDNNNVYVDPHYPSFINRLQNNLAYLLNITRSPGLKILLVSVAGLEQVLPSQTQANSWENGPLFEFLRYHRNSLDTLILPSQVFGEPPGEFDGEIEFPNHIKRIKLATKGSRRHNLSKNWVRMLLNQDSLEVLEISIRQLPEEPVFPWLAGLVLNCSKTLTHINLALQFPYAVDSSEFQGTLDMRVFDVIESLRILKIWGAQKLMIFNLNKLPFKSIVNLRLWSTQIADFDGMEFLSHFNGTELSLDMVSAAGKFKDPVYAFRFIKAALRSRSLEVFYINLAGPELSFKSSTVNESYMEPWLAKFELNDFQKLREFRTEFCGCYDPEETDEAKLLNSGGWTKRAGGMNYVEMIQYESILDERREPPFYLPRNLDAFSLWSNWYTKTYRILPSTKPISQRLSDIDIHHVGFNLSASGEQNGNILDDLLVSEDDIKRTDYISFPWLKDAVNTSGTRFWFRPKSIILREKAESMKYKNL